MSSFNCPVCGKAGLPDYTSNATICPQCNSDLKPFSLLHSLKKRNSSKILYGTIFLIICVISFLSLNAIVKKNQIIKSNSIVVEQLKDSISRISVAKAVVMSEKHDSDFSDKIVEIRYKIKSGDHLSKIAQLFYNDCMMYKKIEEDNHLQIPYVLRIGQIIKIRLIQE